MKLPAALVKAHSLRAPNMCRRPARAVLSLLARVLMRRKLLPPRVSVLSLVLVLSGACGDENPTSPPESITGRWAGSAGLGAVSYEVNLTQTGQDVSGTGSFTSPVGSGPFTVTGRVTATGVELLLVSQTLGSTTYVGTFDGPNRIVGHIEHPLYSNLELVLERQ